MRKSLSVSRGGQPWEAEKWPNDSPVSVRSVPVLLRTRGNSRPHLILLYLPVEYLPRHKVRERDVTVTSDFLAATVEYHNPRIFHNNVTCKKTVSTIHKKTRTDPRPNAANALSSPDTIAENVTHTLKPPGTAGAGYRRCTVPCNTV